MVVVVVVVVVVIVSFTAIYFHNTHVSFITLNFLIIILCILCHVHVYKHVNT